MNWCISKFSNGRYRRHLFIDLLNIEDPAQTPRLRYSEVIEYNLIANEHDTQSCLFDSEDKGTSLTQRHLPYNWRPGQYLRSGYSPYRTKSQQVNIEKKWLTYQFITMSKVKKCKQWKGQKMMEQTGGVAVVVCRSRRRSWRKEASWRSLCGSFKWSICIV